MPMRSSHRRSVLIQPRMLGMSVAPGPELEIGHEALDADPDDRDRDQHLPAKAHDLVKAVAREGRADPEIDEEEEADLEEQPEEARAPEHAAEALERREPAAEKEHGGERRDQDRVRVLGQRKERRESRARVLHVKARDNLRLAF